MILRNAHWPAIRDTDFEVAILPWGATEAHNYHLPYATDNIQVEYIGPECARRANEAGASVVVLPTIPFGVNTQQLDIPLTINLNPSTQMRMLGDVVDSLAAAGVPKLVVLNGHGGNHFRQMIRELQATTEVFLCAIEWWRVADASKYFQEEGDHAGELETSVMMHIAPDLVRPLSEAGNGKANPWRIEGFRDGTAWAPRHWTQVTADTGVGDPRHATAEKGAAFLEAVCAKIAAFLVDLDQTPVDEMYVREG